ncbi:MAG: PD40 domain-containing protein [Rubricoccaceae bacterium]
MLMVRCLLVVLLVCLASSSVPAVAQVGFNVFNGRNHPEIDWQVAETARFEIMYPEHLEGIEAEAAAIAEVTLDSLIANLSPPEGDPISFPDKIRIYLSDEDEIANGVAFDIGRSGYTAIWVHVNDFASIWTGDVKWLRKVLSHELAHIVHYRAIRSNVGLLQNLLAEGIPSFWAEGLAQYQTERWDAQRGDRWLRTATFEDRLNYNDGTSPNNGRLKYAVGNSQIRYLTDTYGDSTLAKILAHRSPALFGLASVHDFALAFQRVTGKSYREFNEEWRKHVNVYYNTQAGQMERLDSLGVEPLAFPGQVIREVAFSPDTTQIAAVVLTSLTRPVTRLFVMNNLGADSTKGRETNVLVEGSIVGPISWHPDGSQIAYTRSHRGRHGSIVRDLYVVDVATERSHQLTDNRRASSPSWSPDGRQLAFVGVDGPTANVFVLDLETGDERPLTAFTGDVQIPTARWSPDGQHIAFSIFDADRRRGLSTVDVTTGEIVELATGTGVPEWEQDDRLPVWNAAGDSLAFTSLRDGAPNGFVVGVGDQGLGIGNVASSDSAPFPDDSPARGASAFPVLWGDGSASPNPQHPTPNPGERSEQRLTFLYDGATIHDWLPPDSLHPAGRLVLVSSETKRRDRVFVVDARRRPTLSPNAVRVPDAYASWTEHRPPARLPDVIEPDESLIQERYAYNSWANITHGLTLPFPYGDPGEDGELFTGDDDWGVFANSLWLEPLGKHQILALAGISITRPIDRSFLLFSYTNKQLAPTLTLDLYRFPSPSSFYGNGVLVEDLTGGDLSATLPLDVLDKPYTSFLTGARIRYAYASPFDIFASGGLFSPSRPDDEIDLGGDGEDLPQPQAGTRFDVQLGVAYKFQRPYRYNVITPLDGTGIRARVTAGAPILGSDNEFVRPDVLFYTISPEIGLGRFFVKGRATAQFGRQLAQDYVGLARYDDVDIQVPFVGAITLDDAERVRGYRRYAVGSRALFGSLEYRLPILFDLQTTVLGFARFGAVAPALFADAGMVWSGSDLDNAVQRVGIGGELKNVVDIAGFQFLHALGLGVPADRAGDVWDGSLPWDDVDLYYRFQAAVPF